MINFKRSPEYDPRDEHVQRLERKIKYLKRRCKELEQKLIDQSKDNQATMRTLCGGVIGHPKNSW